MIKSLLEQERKISKEELENERKILKERTEQYVAAEIQVRARFPVIPVACCFVQLRYFDSIHCAFYCSARLSACQFAADKAEAETKER